MAQSLQPTETYSEIRMTISIKQPQEDENSKNARLGDPGIVVVLPTSHEYKLGGNAAVPFGAAALTVSMWEPSVRLEAEYVPAEQSWVAPWSSCNDPTNTPLISRNRFVRRLQVLHKSVTRSLTWFDYIEWGLCSLKPNQAVSYYD